jgi:hypothetical protein
LAKLFFGQACSSFSLNYRKKIFKEMGVQDYVSAPAGGSLMGYRKNPGDETGAFPNVFSESAWIATFVMFILYLVHLLIAPYLEVKTLRKEAISETPPMTEAEWREPTEGATSSAALETGEASHVTVARAEEASKTRRTTSDLLDAGLAFRDGFLILLGTTLVYPSFIREAYL